MQLTAALQAAFDAAIDVLDPPQPWGLAVSGGPDSTVLMHLASRSKVPPVVLTVDHGLRDTSAIEAAGVAAAAGRLGLVHETLIWSGPKPAHGIQAAARHARYRLMAEACAKHGIASLMTGHTRDDQIETVAMRRTRGSGSFGLAGMPSQALLPGTAIRLVRPLIAMSKADLTAWLNAARIPYVTDPSNSDPKFDRARLRLAAGDGPPAEAILDAQTSRARAETEILRLLTRHARFTGRAIIMPRTVLRELDEDYAILGMASLLRAAAGRDYPGTRAERLRLWHAIRSPGPIAGRTLAGVQIRRATTREAGKGADSVAFASENATQPPACAFWLPFAQYPQIGIDGVRLTISTIFTVP